MILADLQVPRCVKDQGPPTATDVALLMSPDSNWCCMLRIRGPRQQLISLQQGCTTFCYCRPHYSYLYEVPPPM